MKLNRVKDKFCLRKGFHQGFRHLQAVSQTDKLNSHVLSARTTFQGPLLLLHSRIFPTGDSSGGEGWLPCGLGQSAVLLQLGCVMPGAPNLLPRDVEGVS